MNIDRDDFTNWVASKAPDEVYDYCSNSHCALAQYLRAKGVKEPMVGGYNWHDDSKPDWVAQEIPEWLFNAFGRRKRNCQGDYTFGQLLTTLRAT